MAVCLFSCKSQNTNTTVSFDSLIKHFQESTNTKDSVWFPLWFFKNSDSVSIKISDNPIVFELKEIVLKNPHKNSISYENLPISYSIIYQNKLVSLFETGFACFSIPEMKRDADFEKTINTKKFQYHWVLDNELVAISEGEYYTLNAENVWIEYTETIPFKNQPKLFEDSLYLSFCDCYGEFGGTAYFYNKETKNIHFTSATCANTIFKENNTYFILSHLGHMLGGTDLKSISNPSELPIIEPQNVNQWHKYKRQGYEIEEAWGYLDSSGKAKTVFDFYGLQIFATFVSQGRTIYVVYWNDTTFLAEIENNRIKIVNPLFNNRIYPRSELLTTNYGEITLINFNYRVHEFREMSCMLVYNNQLLKIDWNEKRD